MPSSPADPSVGRSILPSGRGTTRPGTLLHTYAAPHVWGQWAGCVWWALAGGAESRRAVNIDVVFRCGELVWLAFGDAAGRPLPWMIA